MTNCTTNDVRNKSRLMLQFFAIAKVDRKSRRYRDLEKSSRHNQTEASFRASNGSMISRSCINQFISIKVILMSQIKPMYNICVYVYRLFAAPTRPVSRTLKSDIQFGNGAGESDTWSRGPFVSESQRPCAQLYERRTT